MLSRGEIEKIICDKCGYANEAQRIFCHECGARLDRSEYLKEVEKRRAKESEAAPRRMKDLARPPLMMVLRPWLIVIFGSALLALLIQMFSPPTLPEQEFGDALQGQAMDMGILFDEATITQGKSSLLISEEILNAHFDRRIKAGSGDTFWEKTLVGAHVDIQPEMAVLTAKRKIYGVPISMSVGMDFQQEGGELKPEVVHAAMGRQALPAFVFAKPGVFFNDVLSAAKINESQARKLTNVELRKDAMQVTVDGTR